ncbi:hypothetical protein [Cryptosporangium aurantiacum]|uniref:Secreted protein n=1 Tax=Cryptosporangium aurantiacum TaxID=134849 RepID=A0A1M7NRK0_9ACTN|nr:hypothetical protein [Cryptosporangium aurantiacum]SHN06658.1 hypothetical protein SAMN05443668_102810 [Cryptosporangium aurantiacum]
MRRTRALALVPFLLALVLAGCGSDDGDDQVASVADRSTAAGASASPTISRDEMGVKFAQCLRENGLDVADPEPGKGVRMKFGKETDPQKVEAAMEACREYNPQADSSGNAESDKRNRAFAQCMRQHGVEKFADPEPGQTGIRINPEVGDDPDFPAAQQACESVLSGGGQ